MPRVLIVDDDATQLTLRARLVEAGGYEVSVAFCPSEALRQVARADAVVTDLRFANAQGESDPAEGRKLIRQIRESGCRAPVIVISGWPEDLDGTPEAQFVSRVMVKPAGMALLLAALTEVLDARSRAADAG